MASLMLTLRSIGVSHRCCPRFPLSRITSSTFREFATNLSPPSKAVVYEQQGPPDQVTSCRYADRPLPQKIDRRRSIEGEIRSIEGEKGKKKKRKRKKRREEENIAPVLARAPSSPSPAVRRRPWNARARLRPHPREETE
ncbi:hypothetical protein GW17_00024944 [Ensete ventricosum]|nr:hypothetical protein GW17_00024944 [Ensete ventricosum]